MKIRLFSFLFLFLSSFLQAQVGTPNFNLNFEQVSSGEERPKDWMRWGNANYGIQKDTTTVQEGKVSAVITSIPDASAQTFGSIAYRLPTHFKGKSITLEGYIKFEGVNDGYVGLLLRLDGKDGTLEFDNMDSREIKGTKDWKKYSVTLPFHENASNIFVAGILVGPGKAWFDDFKVSIDGQDIQTLQAVPEKEYLAEKDTEFDTGSNIEIENLTQEQNENLYLLGKIWGFLKYYHPKIADGALNWDYELFRIIPQILQVGEEETTSNILMDWIAKLGPVEVNRPPASEQVAIKIEAPIQWIYNERLLGKELSKRLSEIEKAKLPETHYYIDFAPSVGNPIFQHEKAYKEMDYTDDGFRLLALFRYWNMIEYYFPYKHLSDHNWDHVLRDMILPFAKAESELDYKLQLLKLIGAIQDTHANIWQRDEVLDQFWGVNIAPITIRHIEDKIVVTKIFDQLEEGKYLAVGDIITAINGVPVEQLIKEKQQYCPASNVPTQMRDVCRKLLRTNEQQLVLDIAGKEKVTINCVDYTTINFWSSDTPSYKNLDGNIGYLYPGNLKEGEIRGIIEQLKSTDGLVIDLRCYPSQFIVFTLGNFLAPQASDFVKFSKGNYEQAGEFIFTPIMKVGSEYETYGKKIVVLVNETTQSQAEYTTMAFQAAPDVRVIGSTTAAADGNVSRIILPGNVRSMISGIGVYYPDGKETQRIGVAIDHEMRPTVAGIRAGKDELLEKALELLKQ